jgi:large subunit ribosomal protein L3
MGIAVYGTKVGMTRVYDGDVVTPVTVIEVQSNDVVEVKTADKHGYQALKVAVGPAKKKVCKPLAGEFAKAEVKPRRFLREVPAVDGVELGGQVTIGLLDESKLVDATAITKGRGFTGVMKRYNFAGHKDSHGATKSHRGPGSIGCRMDPGKVFKNKKMAGQYGVEQVTVRNLRIVKVDADRNLVLIKGAVPGPNGGLVNLRQA